MERPPSRTGFRFRLRTVFVLSTVYAVVLGLGFQELYREHQRKQIAIDIKNRRGYVFYRSPHELRDNGYRASGTVKGWLRIFLGDDYFTEASSVGFEPSSSEDLNLLFAFPEMESLELSGAAVTDDLLHKLSALSQLHGLSLDAAQLSDRGLESLTAFSSLRSLCLVNCSLSDQSLEVLTKLPQLGFLELANCSLSDGTLTPLTQCTRLHTLRLRYSPPSEGSLMRLASPQSLSVADYSLIDAHLQSMHGAPSGVTLELHSTDVTEAAMLALREANPGWSIRFENRSSSKEPITEGGYLPSIRELPNVNKLAFQGLLTSHETLAVLKEAKSLSTLELNGCRLSDGDLQYLRPLQNLTLLQLADIPVTDKDLQALEGLTKLKTLGLIGTKVNGIGLGSLPSSVTTLRFISSEVVNTQLADITKLTSLTGLDLGSAQLSDDVIEHLARMPSLREVSVYGTPISAALAARLQQALPKCSIMLP